MLTSELSPSRLAADTATQSYAPTTVEEFGSAVVGAMAHSIPAELGGIIDKAAAVQRDWTAEDLAASPYAGKVKWEPGMTDHRAKLLAAEHDRDARQAFVDSHWTGGGLTVVKTLGSIAGGLLDPTNYIPVLGEAGGAFLTARLGKVGAGAVEGAVTNLALSAAGAGLDVANRSMLQEDPDFQGAALNIAIATGIGTVLGGVMGRFFAKTPEEALATGTAKALDDISQGKAIDLAGILEPEARIRAAEREQWLSVLQDPDAPITTQERAAMELGIDPTLPPEEIAAKIAELPKEQPDFQVAADRSTPFQMPEEGPKTEGSLTGASPEVEQAVNERFADLEANEGTKALAKEATDEIEKETRGLQEKSKAILHAAMCLAREVF